MPKRTVALGPGVPKKAVLEWEAGWGNLRLIVDGIQLGEAIDKERLTKGHEWPLPDRSKLFVRLRGALAGGGLEIKRTGMVKSVSGARRDLNYSSSFVFVVALLNIVLGGLSTLGQSVLSTIDVAQAFSQKLAGLGFLAGSILTGAVYLLVAICVRRGSAIAIGIGLGIVILELVGGYLLLQVYWVAGYENAHFLPIPLILKLLVIVFLVLALFSVETLRKKPKMYVGGP